jgi:NitT/TauT family transport system substrate-binding protein
MRRSITWGTIGGTIGGAIWGAIVTALAVAVTAGSAGAQVQTMRVGWCAKTVSSAAAPFAIATKLGWFEKDGIKVTLVPVPGSTDCMKLVATRELQAALPSVEPLAIIRPQGVKAKFFYTAYQGNIYGIAVPESSTARSMTDLKGKKIGVISMGSAGVIVARALAKAAGMNPDTDISIIVAGEAAQTAALINSKQVDALSQFDTQYAMTNNAGAKLRLLEHPEIKKFPSNGFVALEEFLSNNRKQAVALARGYAKGQVFAIANPEAAIRILWEVFPQTRATGKDEATALRDDLITLDARAKNWRYEPVGGKRWGDNVEANYQAYLDWLLAQGIIKTKTDAKDIVTNDLLDEVDNFDPAALAAEAKAYKAK